MEAWTFHWFDEIDSTSTWLKGQNGLPHKTVAVTDFQSAGRGRLGRQWLAPPGTALMMSLLLRPVWPVAQGQWLTMISGLAAAETLANISALPIKLKWPNDIVIENGSGVHKLGGILQEVEIEDGRISEAIIGIGLNINMSTEQLPPATHTPAASLYSLRGNRFDRDQILDAFLANFDQLLSQCEKGQSPQKRWEAQLITLGKRVTVTFLDGVGQKIDGVADGVDKWGRLLVRTDGGKLETVGAGDVTLRGE